MYWQPFIGNVVFLVSHECRYFPKGCVTLTQLRTCQPGGAASGTTDAAGGAPGAAVGAGVIGVDTARARTGAGAASGADGAAAAAARGGAA